MRLAEWAEGVAFGGKFSEPCAARASVKNFPGFAEEANIGEALQYSTGGQKTAPVYTSAVQLFD